DPSDWAAMRTIAHKMVDEMMDFIQNIHEQPVWKPIPEEIKDNYQNSLPLDGIPIDEVYEEFKRTILPYYKGNIHPTFWAWVQGTGSATAAMADMLASFMNSNVTIGEHSAMYIDAQVVNWCKEMMGFPKEASGLLTSGGSMANFTALTVARNTFTKGTARFRGLKELDKQLVIYCSDETHSCVIKAIEVLGIGSDYIRKIAVNDHYQIDIKILQSAIEKDIGMGLQPFCIVANVGTVNTGAIDDLEAIKSLCDTFGLWMHVDGAFGALTKLVPSFQKQLKILEQVDSLVFDLHKWMYMPYEVGCVLFQSAKAHRASYAIEPNYLLKHERGLAAGPDSLNNFGLELSRGFKALKVWMSLKENGIQKYAQLIEQNILQIKYLSILVEDNPNLELCAPVVMNVLCFRYYDPSIPELDLDVINKGIVMALQERGIASPSSTILHGRYCIRVAH
ncbi:MAG TPA: aminotransferase class V-fold PLP-dependent enzyme, partial [Saprospiraceae bacterium]|nr:aminotransferase class V-fold PLP-dependent enzyme [Saprospiraceae bacterium]